MLLKVMGNMLRVWNYFQDDLLSRAIPWAWRSGRFAPDWPWLRHQQLRLLGVDSRSTRRRWHSTSARRLDSGCGFAACRRSSAEELARAGVHDVLPATDHLDKAELSKSICRGHFASAHHSRRAGLVCTASAVCSRSCRRLAATYN